MPIIRCWSPLFRVVRVRRPLSRLIAAVTAVALFLLLAAPARSQALCTLPPGEDTPTVSGGFFNNFLVSNPGLYEIPLGSSMGTGASGDLNSTYFSLYYSIANMLTWMAPGSSNYCPLEILIVSTLPNARYLSVTGNDMHYAMAQHLADANIDPVNNLSNPGSSYSNSFTPNTPYTAGQYYLVPIGLGGALPLSGAVPGCAITPSEQDNLLDATQHHLSMDWNTNLSPFVGVTHPVDPPDHSFINSAGSVLIRNYLPFQTCATVGGVLTCGPNPALPIPQLIIRDAYTGCPIKKSYLTNLVYQLATPPTCPGTSCNAIVSTIADPSGSTSNWLDSSAHANHINVANTIPQKCFSSGFGANKVAWTRSPEYVGQPSPDDAYIGGAISETDLGAVATGAGCSALASESCVIQFQFQMPDMPNTPCAAGGGCQLSGTEELRYLSLTFGYQPPPNQAGQYFVANGDGIGGGRTIPTTKSLVSLADVAFKLPATGTKYATLLVYVGNPNMVGLPPGLQQNAPGAVGVQTGVSPAVTGNKYSVWQVNGYTVLDLTQFPDFISKVVAANGNASLPLLLTIRNTMPNASFKCAGAVVPFSTAEYTAAGGLMGPYVPVVSYVDAFDLPTSPATPTLPPITACGVIPTTGQPYSNNPTSTNLLNFPLQYFSTSVPATPPNLSCGTTVGTISPIIDFVGTQFTVPIDDPGVSPPGATNCATANQCNQIIIQSTQQTELPGGANWQPGLPLTIVGSGFGILPNNLPYAVAGTSFSYLIVNDSTPGYSWNTNSTSGCEMYITNWSDTVITAIPNLLPSTKNPYEVFNNLPPSSQVTDLTPFDFDAPFPATTSGCPIAAGDSIKVTVTNPQSLHSVVSSSIVVSSTASPY